MPSDLSEFQPLDPGRILEEDSLGRRTLKPPPRSLSWG